MKQSSLRQLAVGGVIAAAYAALSLALAPISFGVIQCRVSEAFTLLPVLSPYATWGVTLGCAITNAVGVSTGANFLGAADIIFGTLATLAAALCSRALGHIRWKGLPLLSVIPPVLINAVVLGGEWCWAMTGSLNGTFWLLAGEIALGQLLPCLLGAFFVKTLEVRNLRHIIEGN